MKRRHFVLGALGAGTALTIGWGVLPPRQRLTAGQPLPASAGQVAFNGWVKIGADDSVTVIMAKSEMGQGIHTGLAMILAEELDADWARVRVEAAPVDAIYNNLATVVDALPFHPDQEGAMRSGLEWLTAKLIREVGLMMTGGSSSMKDLWLPMRQAGASARAMLVAAAAAQWGVPAAEVQVGAGVLEHASGKSARFGELALAAAALPVPHKPTLKDPAAFKLVGQPLHRLEAARKIDGTARFGIDVLPPGLLYASVLMCPTLGGRVAMHDGTAVSRLPGVRKVLAFEPHEAGGTGGVAVIAAQPWQAMQAVKQVAVQWDAGPAANISSAALMSEFALALDRDQDGGGFTYFARGDVLAALAGATKTLAAEYRAPYLAHMAMEPINCTVLVKEGAATVWAPTQVPDIARAVAAKALGIAEDKVDVEVQFLGGGFGRRLDVDFVAQAVVIAQAVPGSPVQVIWTREQDTRHDFYRPAAVSRFKAGLDASGKLVAWSNHSASQAIVPQAMARYAAGMTGLPLVAKGQALLGKASQPLGYLPGMGMGIDKTAAEGSFDQPYEFAAVRVGHTIVESPMPVGFWRSVGHSQQAFFKESFIDEVAHAAAQDPVAYRAALLGQHPRHLKVLQRAAELAGWAAPPPPAPDGAKVARGVALHQSFGSIVAQVAEVSVAPDKTIRVHRVVAVIDCGTPVNPNLIRQQLESAIVFGLSAALYGGVTVEKGQVQQSNFHDQPALRIDACPVIVTDIIASTAHPAGVGEPGTPPIAPAVSNALFALTGQRLRALPLKLS